MHAKEPIQPYEWHGLKGRMMHLPGPPGKKSNMLLVYGQHASLERCLGIGEAMQQYCDFWLVDMPGFGGMPPLHDIQKLPDVEEYADYLYDFIQKHLPEGPLVLVGMSFGFANLTRLLQKHPELVERVELLVSFVGFTGARDFDIKPWYLKAAAHSVAKGSRGKAGAAAVRTLVDSYLFELMFRSTLKRPKPYTKEAKEFNKMVAKNKVHLWRINDHRTHAYTGYEFIFKLDLRGTRVPLLVHHMGVDYDRYFNHKVVVEHMKEIYDGVVNHKLTLANHSPPEDAKADEVMAMLPDDLKAILAKLP